MRWSAAAHRRPRILGAAGRVGSPPGAAGLGQERPPVGIGPEGAVLTSGDGGESWQESGSLPEPPHAFTATADRWYAATESGILTSTDEGNTWTEMTSP